MLSLTALRELLKLSLPMMVSQGAFAVMVFTDRFFMSYIDATHIAASLGGGVAAFFCFMFSWVELLIARTLTITEAKPISAVLTRTVTGEGVDWGLIAAAGILTIIPGALVIYFVRNYIAKGFALGRV